MTTKQLNIKNRTYYFYNDLINVLHFEASNLKLDKKTSMSLDIYYIGYTIGYSVNPLYLMINSRDGYFEKVDGVKYLNIADTVRNNDVFKKYKQVFDGIKYHIKKIDNNNGEYQTDYKKITFSSDDDIPLNKVLYFPQVYLDDCLYQV